MFQKLKNWINRRSIEMEEAAELFNMDYSKEDVFGLSNLLQDFQLFNQGHSKSFKHILRSRPNDTDLHVDIFDYKYTTGAGKSQDTSNQTIFFLQSKKLNLPQFYMQPEHFFHTVAAFFGWEDIDFVENQVFSDQYHLKGNNEYAIRKAMNDDVLHFFTIEKDWSMEGIGYYMIFYQAGKRFSKHEIRILMDNGLSVYHFLTKKT